MKLRWISLRLWEGAREALMAHADMGVGRYSKLRSALSFMPSRKVDHSMRVGATAAKAGLGEEEVEAAVLHDYIERGGDLSVLVDKLHVKPRTIAIIKMLSIDEKSPGMDDTKEVQHHIEQMLADSKLDQHDKNVAIIIKCADRIDNVKKRIKKGKLTPEYRAASLRLFQTLLQAYTGPDVHVKHIKLMLNKLNMAS